MTELYLSVQPVSSARFTVQVVVSVVSRFFTNGRMTASCPAQALNRKKKKKSLHFFFYLSKTFICIFIIITQAKLLTW